MGGWSDSNADEEEYTVTQADFEYTGSAAPYATAQPSVSATAQPSQQEEPDPFVSRLGFDAGSFFEGPKRFYSQRTR